jgi:ATP-dependent exoDNAse (exonuclease V), alpha subunit - helicase superfamily I member
LISQGEIPEKPRLYMLDEAGMVSARDYAAFFELIERDGGRSISVGDYRQLSSVEAGAPFEQLVKSESMATAVIDEIQRQKNEQLLAVVQHFATGDAAGGVKLAQPFITQDVDFSRKAAEKYLSLDVGERDNTIMMTTTNATRQAVNDEIREALRDRGAIGKKQIQLLALDKVDFTREEYKRADKYEPGMILRLSHSIKSDDKIAAAKN